MSDSRQSNVVEASSRFTTARAASDREDREQQFRHEEERRDNEAARWRGRWLFVAILATAALLFLIGFALAFFSNDGASKEFGRALVFAVFSAAVAALGGYATGRSSR